MKRVSDQVRALDQKLVSLVPDQEAIRKLQRWYTTGIPGIPGIPGVPVFPYSRVFPVFPVFPGYCTFGVPLLVWDPDPAERRIRVLVPRTRILSPYPTLPGHPVFPCIPVYSRVFQGVPIQPRFPGSRGIDPGVGPPPGSITPGSRARVPGGYTEYTEYTEYTGKQGDPGTRGH